MRTFDESVLVAELEHLPAPLRVVFAAACAERQMQAYRSFKAQTNREVPDALERALAEVWDDPSPVENRGAFDQKIEELMVLIPQEEGFQQPWTQDVTNAQNAGIAAVYAIRAKLAGEAQEAAWAARVAYEALDSFVINSEALDTNKPGEEQRVLMHPLVQAELERQQRDLEELRGCERDQFWLLARVRERASADAAIFFGST